MIRSLALLLIVIPAVAVAQQADTSARMTVSSRMTGPTDSMVAHDTPSMAAGVANEGSDSVFVLAQRMVAEGEGDQGRALVQAQLDSSPIGSPQYVKALYWHAVVAATAAGAERDLRRLVIEYPLSPVSADALLRLAQLEMARGDRQQALEHLDRLLLEHPNDPSRGRAGLWMGRLLLENGQAAAACARLDQAENATPVEDVELRNQIAYYKQRCVGVDTSTASRADTAPAAPAERAPTAPVDKTPATPADRAPAKPIEPTPVKKAPEPRASPAPVEKRASNSASAARYTIQIAAFGTSAAAERLRDGPVSRGFDARVVGAGRYYRVRIGRYATRREALAATKDLKARHIDGLIVEMEPK